VRPRCKVESPALRFEAGQGVACHFWKEIAAPAALPLQAPAPTPARERLARLQAAFRADGESAAQPT
jgi:peptide/nickel transport system ATP-binding protein/oligopeptide transport system ATP-binding protein